MAMCMNTHALQEKMIAEMNIKIMKGEVKTGGKGVVGEKKRRIKSYVADPHLSLILEEQ